MKTLIVFISLLVTITSCQTNEEKVSPEEIEKKILANEHAMWDRWSAGDPLGFAESFNEDATLFRWSDIETEARLDGVEEIQQYLTGFEGQIPAHNYEMVDTKFQIYDDFVIVTFEYHGTMPDGESLPAWKSTNVYRLVNNEWEIIHSHWSLVN